MADYPIKPGSPIDLALDSCARYIASDYPFNIEAFKLVSMSNPAHMLALGTRIWLLRAKVREPHDLVTSMNAQWYGQASGEHRTA